MRLASLPSVLEAKAGKGDELAAFLRGGRDLAAAEPDIRLIDVIATT